MFFITQYILSVLIYFLLAIPYSLFVLIYSLLAIPHRTSYADEGTALIDADGGTALRVLQQGAVTWGAAVNVNATFELAFELAD